MVKVPNEELDAEIERALREALQPLGVDRGGLLEVDENSPVVRISHVWYAEGAEHVSAEVNLAELFPWSYRHLVQEGKVKNIASIDDYPPGADIDRQSCLALGSKSDLAIPLFIGPRVHHLLAINSLRTERDWPAELIVHLRLLGEIFVSALQRREMEQALRQTRDRLDLAAEAAEVVFWKLDLETGSLWANDKCYELFGFDPSTAMTLTLFLEKVHADDHERIRQAIEQARRTGSEVTVEYRAPLADGRVRWMISRGRLICLDKPSAPCRLMGITMEITKRKEMEQQLQEQLREIACLHEQLEAENAYLRNEVVARDEQRGLHNVGSSMQAIMVKVEQVAGTGSTVLIQGETGTGKEVLAQAIHRLSARGKRVMIKVNCAALPTALVESELFGHEKGAFTGALSRQAGRFELADGSTLFLDEIAEMPLETQAKLLRVLQEGEFERLGSPKTFKVDVRVIAASNRDLAAEVEQGRFRRDLYYRLNIFPIHLPPLRERREDIPQLVWEFVNEFGERMGKKIRRIANRDMEQLKAYSWPGNIRELRNVIEHALIVSKGETLELQRLVADPPQGSMAVTLEEMERRHIQETLRVTRGKVKGAGGAAEQLGINPSTLYSRMLKLGIHPSHA
ncbi:MAG: PAS domain S-box protein [Desulfuromonas sp.]|nr:PAS domain S-box protein [Desulfuromonas sp.]